MYLEIIHTAYYWISNSTSHAIYRALQFSKFQKHGGVFYIWECNVVNLAKSLPCAPALGCSLQVCGWALVDIYSCLFIASKEHVTLFLLFFLVLQPPVTRVTSGWLVGPFPTVDVWRYVSTTCGGLSVTMCGELMMHW